jgi:hypothetical protein
MKTFELELFEGHPIIRDDNNTILIDTGSPVTLHHEGSLSFCSQELNVITNYMGLTVSGISNMLGMPLTTLMGTDSLSRYNLKLDYRNSVAVFMDQSETEGDGVFQMSSFMEIPILEVTIQGNSIKVFLDTGAKISYLLPRYTAPFESLGIEKDFYPTIGEFNTPVFEINTHFEQHDFAVKYGNLPPLLEQTLMMGGVQGILGYDFFNRFSVVLNLREGKLFYEA